MTEENRTTMRVILCRPNERRGATSEYTEGAIQVQERSEICEMLKEKFGEKNPDVKVQ